MMPFTTGMLPRAYLIKYLVNKITFTIRQGEECEDCGKTYMCPHPIHRALIIQHFTSACQETQDRLLEDLAAKYFLMRVARHIQQDAHDRSQDICNHSIRKELTTMMLRSLLENRSVVVSVFDQTMTTATQQSHCILVYLNNKFTSKQFTFKYTLLIYFYSFSKIKL